MNKIILFSVLLLFGCTSSRTLVTGSANLTKMERDLRSSIANQADHFIGTRYRYGGSDRKGLDCSGLVYTVFREHALALPRSSAEQLRVGREISPQTARVGDLIFFRQNGKVNHVAIVTDVRGGDLWVTHSTTSRGVVKENLFASAYWSNRIEGVRDIIADGAK